MSTIQCEVDEVVAAASSVADAEILVTVPNGVNASDTYVVGASPSVIVAVAAAVDEVTYDGYAVQLVYANAIDIAQPDVDIYYELSEKIKASDKPQVYLDAMVAAGAAATASAYYDVPVIISEVVTALSTATPSSATVITLGDTVKVRDASVLGTSYEVIDDIVATANSVTVLRVLEAEITDNTSLTDEFIPSNVIGYLVYSSANAAVAIPIADAADQFVTVVETITACDIPISRNTGAKAWVLNTETGAASWYSNFDIQSLAQTPQGVLAAGPGGLYAIDADDDEGEPITSEVQYGFSDFKTPYTKRIDQLYVGYKSSGTISVKCETYGDDNDKGPESFLSELRIATAPRNTRITPAKGLSSRYWRITVTNVDGAGFTILDSSADLAISKRRI